MAIEVCGPANRAAHAVFGAAAAMTVAAEDCGARHSPVELNVSNWFQPTSARSGPCANRRKLLGVDGIDKPILVQIDRLPEGPFSEKHGASVFMNGAADLVLLARMAQAAPVFRRHYRDWRAGGNDHELAGVCAAGYARGCRTAVGHKPPGQRARPPWRNRGSEFPQNSRGSSNVPAKTESRTSSGSTPAKCGSSSPMS